MDTPTAAVPDLRGYTRVVVVTGAGISAPSGVPTYRAAGSGWDQPNLEKMSHASRYGNYLPQLWGFWGPLRHLTASAEPNPAHRALTSAAARCAAAGGWLSVITQNVDGLHTRAGTPEVLELHGSIHRSRCMRRCSPPAPDATVPDPGQVPPCPRCGRDTRPDVVLFGERLPAPVVKAATARLASAEACVYVGTSGQVHPAASMVGTAARAGARCILVNAQPWDEPDPAFTDVVLGDAAALLPAMLA